MPRRLLLAGGGGSFTIPQSVFTLMGTSTGGVVGISKTAPAGFTYNGKVYLGWVTNAGAVQVQAYDLATQALIGSPVTLATGGEAHAAPSVIVRTSDRRVMVAWSKHDENDVHQAISTNPEDASAFSSSSIKAQVDGSADYTYNSQVELTSEGTLWRFWRDYTGSTGRLAYSTSADNGATWATRTLLVKPNPDSGGNVVYWRVVSNWTDRIDIFTTNTTRDDARPSSLFHLYWHSGDWHQSDGTVISAAKPFDASAATLVADTAAVGIVDPSGACFDGTNPACSFQAYQTGTTTNHVYTARYRSGAWVLSNILDTGGIISSNRFVGSSSIHGTNPNLVYTHKKVSTHFQAHRCTSADDGATWTVEQLTSDANDRMLFCHVQNGGAGLRAMWNYGSLTNDSTHTLGIEGLT